jgi:hypothetical protein
MSAISNVSEKAILCSFNSVCNRKGKGCEFLHIPGVCVFCLQGKCRNSDCAGKTAQVVDKSKSIYSYNNQQFIYRNLSEKKEVDKKSDVSSTGKTVKTSSKKKFIKKIRYSEKLIKLKLGDALVDAQIGKYKNLIRLNKKINEAKQDLIKELEAISKWHDLVQANMPKQSLTKKLSEVNLAEEDDSSSSSDEETNDN